MVKQQSYKYFSIELSTILLGFYDFLEKLVTMGATSRTGVKNYVHTVLDATIGEKLISCYHFLPFEM